MHPIPLSSTPRKRRRPSPTAVDSSSAILPRALALITRHRRTAEGAWLDQPCTGARSRQLDRLIQGEQALRELLSEEPIS